jgi:hypothetical protein
MSNATKKIKKEIAKPNELYTTLIGSIISTVGMLSGKSEIQNRKLFNILKKDPKVLPDTVEKICDYIFTVHGDENVKEEFKSRAVLVYDEQNIRQPLVCLMSIQTTVNDDGDEVDYPVLLPLDPKGDLYGVMRAFMSGSPTVYIESVYEQGENNE